MTLKNMKMHEKDFKQTNERKNVMLKLINENETNSSDVMQVRRRALKACLYARRKESVRNMSRESKCVREHVRVCC